MRFISKISMIVILLLMLPAMLFAQQIEIPTSAVNVDADGWQEPESRHEIILISGTLFFAAGSVNILTAKPWEKNKKTAGLIQIAVGLILTAAYPIVNDRYGKDVPTDD